MCFGTMDFDTSFSNIQPSIRNMKVIGMTCVMTMHITFPLKKNVKYFGDLLLMHWYMKMAIM